MRACGILMPVFSLPGPFGIGTLGKEAFAFVDFLAGSEADLLADPAHWPDRLRRQPLPELFRLSQATPISLITGCWSSRVS